MRQPVHNTLCACYLYQMQIRKLTDDDIPAVAALMRALSEEFIVHDSAPEVQAAFILENNAAGIRRFVDAGMDYRIAVVDGCIAGFIAMRDNSHVFHMFVEKAYQRKGVATALWQAARLDALAAGNPGLFTVNASNYAVPVYERMGFSGTGGMQCKNGIYYNPMQLDGRAHD